MNPLIQEAANPQQFPAVAIFVVVLGFILATTIGSWAWFQSKRSVGWKEGNPKGEAQAPGANYDRGLIPAEVAARMEREGDSFKQLPNVEPSINTTEGYTMDREGRLNNYAIEPEMYVEEPGDLRDKEDALKAERVRELQEVNSNSGKGPGVI